MGHPDHFVVNGKEVYDKTKIVEGFNNFFVEVGPKLARKISNAAQPVADADICIHSVRDSVFLGAVTQKEIIDTVKLCKNKFSTDEDGIDMFLVKNTINCIIDPLTYIFNLSFRTGAFPEMMKVAKVIILFKSGDKHSFTNYRPISLLSQFSKVLEKPFNNKLDKFIEKKHFNGKSVWV